MFLLGAAFPIDELPLISQAKCPPYQNYDECFSLDFRGTMFDDTMLLEYVPGALSEYGPVAQYGHLKNEPDSFVIASRKTPIDSKIEV